VVFETDQFVSKLRVGDVVRVDAAKKIELQLVAEGPPADDGSRSMRFVVGSGKTFLDAFLMEDVRLLPSGSGFSGFYSKPEVSPWILQRESQDPGQGSRSVPGDPEHALEALR